MGNCKCEVCLTSDYLMKLAAMYDLSKTEKELDIEYFSPWGNDGMDLELEIDNYKKNSQEYPRHFGYPTYLWLNVRNKLHFNKVFILLRYITIGKFLNKIDLRYWHWNIYKKLFAA
jgi:hypothetical protein